MPYFCSRVWSCVAIDSNRWAMASCVTIRRALSRCISPVRSVRAFNNWGETTAVMRVLSYVVSRPLLSLFLKDKAMIHCTPLCEAPLLHHEHNLANLCIRGQVCLCCQGLRQWKDTVDKRPQPSIGQGRQEVGSKALGNGNTFIKRAGAEGHTDKLQTLQGQYIQVEFSLATAKPSNTDKASA